MTLDFGGYQFALENLGDEDDVGYRVYWRGEVSVLPVTTWGQGDERLDQKPLPVSFIANTDAPPSPAQRAAFEWLLTHVEEAVARIQAACEDSWRECYYWEGNEMTDEDEYFVEGIRIPPGENNESVLTPRDPSLPALIVVDLGQDWEIEHGFYVVLDPADPNNDQWTTWDGMADLGLCYLEDDEFE